MINKFKNQEMELLNVTKEGKQEGIILQAKIYMMLCRNMLNNFNNHRNICRIIDFEVSERNIKKIQK